MSAWTPQRAGADEQGEDDQQAEPFEQGLVELARVARQRPAEREDHRPGHVGRPAPQLAVDEVREPPEEDPDRPDRAGDVAERQRRDAAVIGEPQDRDDAAEEAAMERHAALPHLEDLQRVLEEVRQVVEQDVADPAAEDDAERHPQDEIVVVGDGERRRAAPQPVIRDEGARVEPAEQDAADIGKCVPAHRKGADRDQHRIEAREGDEGGRHRLA